MAIKIRKKTGTNTFADPITLLEPSDVAPIDLTNQTVSLLTLVQALGTSGVQYAKYVCKTDGGSANITGRPTTNNAGFVCEVLCNRWAGTNDYRYILRYYQQTETNAYLSAVSQITTTISWVRANTNTDINVLQDASTTTNYRPLMLGWTNGANPSSFAPTTGGVYYNVNLYAKPSDGSLYASTFYENGTALSAKYQAKGTYAGTAVATTSANGLMSSTDKTRLDNIYTVLNGSDASKIDTIAEVYAFLEDYAQTTDLAALLANKLDKTAKAADADKLDGQDSSYYLNYNNLSNKPTIPTETTVTNWGFTKNAGTVTSVDSVSPSSGNVALSAVRYVTQSLTDAQKTQARTNIGAGTSNFTGYTSSNKLSTNYIQNDAGWSSFSGYTSSNKLNTDYINNVAGWTSNTGTVTQVKVGTTAYNPSSGVISLPAYPTDTNYYPSRSYSSGLQISTSTNVTNTCALYVPYATADQYGVVKPAAVRSSAITATTGGTTSNRYYGVEKDSNGKLFVNVPWSSGTTTWNSDWGYTLKSYHGQTFGDCYFIDCPGNYCFGCGDSGFFIDAKGIYDSAEEADNMLLVNRDENSIIINRNLLSSIGLWDSSEESWTSYWGINFPLKVGDAGTFALGEKTCGYARCTTSSSTAVKEVTLYNECSDLVDGSMFFLDMNAGNTNTSMSFSIGGLKTFSISNIYVNDSSMSSSYYAFPSGTYLCCVRSNKLYCYPKSLYYYSTTPATSTSTSHVIYKGTFSTNGSATAIATMFHNFKKVVTVYGTEKSQYGTIRIYRGSSEIVAQATGEQGYWAKQDLCLTAIIPAGVDAYLYKTSNMNDLTYHVEVIS